MSDETVTWNLELQVAPTTLSDLRKFELLLYRLTALTRRLGLPEDVDALLAKLQRIIMTVRLLHTSFVAMHTAAGPMGWALAGVGVVSAAFTVGDTLAELGSG